MVFWLAFFAGIIALGGAYSSHRKRLVQMCRTYGHTWIIEDDQRVCSVCDFKPE